MQKISRTILDYILLFAFIVLAIGTLASPNLNGQIIGSCLGVVVAFAYLIFLFRRYAGRLFSPHPRLNRFIKSKWTALVLSLVYQFWLLWGLAGETGFDTGILKWAASSKTITPESYLANYFSNNPNNLALMFAERFIYNLTKGLNFTVTLDVINLVLIDIAIVLMALFLKRHLGHPIYWQLLPLVLIISPWIVIFYSDTVILPFVAAMIYLLDVLIAQLTTETALYKQALTAAGLGLATWLAYVIKPSALIFVIAIMIELVIYLFSNDHHIRYQQLALSIVVMAAVFGIFQVSNESFLQHQQFVSLNQNMKELPSHYIMMGMNKDTTGAYSQEDFLYSTKQPTLAKQQTANVKKIKQRLDAFGVGGYLKFLFVKNYANTSDGTFGWLKEGDFFIKPKIAPHPFIRSMFYNFGSRLNYTQTVFQMIWIGIILGTLFSFLDHSFIARVLRLTFFGLLVFLLFFEGGRSRYMIQFIPVIYAISVIGWRQVLLYLKETNSVKIHVSELFRYVLKH